MRVLMQAAADGSWTAAFVLVGVAIAIAAGVVGSICASHGWD